MVIFVYKCNIFLFYIQINKIIEFKNARHFPEIPIPAEFLNDICVELEDQE
jgi:hypothetical protein